MTTTRRAVLAGSAVAAGTVLGTTEAQAHPRPEPKPKPTVALVHGAFAGRPHQARSALIAKGAAMFERLERTTVRRRWWPAGPAVVFMVFRGRRGSTQVLGSLTNEGFDGPASESSQAVERAEATV